MPRLDPPLSFPVRGVPGGWRDIWDDPDDHEELRICAGTIERLSLSRATNLGRDWQAEIAAERQQAERARKRRGGSG
jgi:hypothetical protein